MKFDEVLEHLGHFGRFQQRLSFLLIIPSFASGILVLANVFLGATPKFRCFVPGVDNVTHPHYEIPNMNVSIPAENPDKPREHTCYWYNRTDWREEVPLQGCDKFVYDRSIYKDSIVTKWDLVCDRSFYNRVAQSAWMAGQLPGAFLSGLLSDKYGRKTILYIMLTLQTINGFATAFATEYYLYVATRAVGGFVGIAAGLPGFVILMEYVGSRWRTAVGLAWNLMFTLGYLTVTLFAYYIRDWQTLAWATTLPNVFFLSYWWLLPESARWALANNRRNDAIAIVKRASVVNRVSIPDHLFQQKEPLEEKKEEKVEKINATVLDLLRTPNIRKKSLNIFLCWMVVSMGYYGLSLNSADFGDDDYLNFFLVGVVEIPAVFLALPAMDRIGRRPSLSVSLLIGGAACAATYFLEKGSPALIILVMVGKLGITAAFSIVYNFSSELFPTVLRNTGMGAASTCARIGSISSPGIAELGTLIPGLPLLIFGGFSLLAGTLSAFLPETRGTTMPETVQDGEDFGKKKDKKAKKAGVAAGVENGEIVLEQLPANVKYSSKGQDTGQENRGFRAEEENGGHTITHI